MKRISVIILFLTLFTLASRAQQYSKAIGIRGGLTSGFEYRFYTDDVNSYKLFISARSNGAQIGAMKEFHQYDLFDFSDQVVFIYGVGLHAGYERWHERHYAPNFTWYETKSSYLAGIDAMAGVEYTFNELPLSMGLEVKPFLNVWGRKTVDVQLFDFAFTLKYLF